MSKESFKVMNIYYIRIYGILNNCECHLLRFHIYYFVEYISSIVAVSKITIYIKYSLELNSNL